MDPNSFASYRKRVDFFNLLFGRVRRPKITKCHFRLADIAQKVNKKSSTLLYDAKAFGSIARLYKT